MASYDRLSSLPEALGMQLLYDVASSRPVLDPQSLARIEAAGGGLGRLARSSATQWVLSSDEHRWLMGRPGGVPTPGQAKQRSLKLSSWATGAHPGRCGHLLLVGGNVDRSQTFAEQPIDDVAAVRTVLFTPFCY